MTLAVLFMPFAGKAQQAELKEVSPIRAKLMVRNGSLMVDVREKDEVAQMAYDVENIINIPLSELESRLDEIPKDKRLVMACRSGNRSRKASKILMSHGYTNLVNMDGGMLEWSAKKLGVITNGKSVKKSCCAHPNSKDCNPDGTCKKGAKASCSKKGGKACCSKKGGKSCTSSKSSN